MSERNPRFAHPEIDIPGNPKALLGVEHRETTPRTDPDKAVDIPSLIRLFETDAYPLSQDAPLRITVSEDASLTLYPNHDAIEYRRQTREHTIYLRASKAGELAFSLTPTPPVAPTHEPESPTAPKRPHSEAVPAHEEAGDPKDEPAPAAPPTFKDRATETENKERVILTGRVGRQPTVKPIKTGLMAKFPVAEHQPDGTTTWHTVVAFGKRAEGLKDSLTKGELVTITGYPHEREITGKSGQPRTVTEIYLAGIKHLPR